MMCASACKNELPIGSQFAQANALHIFVRSWHEVLCDPSERYHIIVLHFHCFSPAPLLRVAHGARIRLWSWHWPRRLLDEVIPGNATLHEGPHQAQLVVCQPFFVRGELLLAGLLGACCWMPGERLQNCTTVNQVTELHGQIMAAVMQFLEMHRHLHLEMCQKSHRHVLCSSLQHLLCRSPLAAMISPP